MDEWSYPYARASRHYSKMLLGPTIPKRTPLYYSMWYHRLLVVLMWKFMRVTFMSNPLRVKFHKLSEWVWQHTPYCKCSGCIAHACLKDKVRSNLTQKGE